MARRLAIAVACWLLTLRIAGQAGAACIVVVPALRRALIASVLVAAVAVGGATASDHGGVVPRFTLGATTATADDEVALRVAQMPRLPQREIRLYLVRASVFASVRSRFDRRLNFIGTVRAARGGRLVFTVPPLEAGRYALAFWCRGCVPLGQTIGVQASPMLRVTSPVTEGCPTTKPNGNVPPVAWKAWNGLPWHGNGGLWVALRADGSLITNALGGWKQLWVAREGASGRLGVTYRMLDGQAEPLTARTGLFSGSEHPNSTMSQMSFQPGCWQITGRLGDLSLRFVVTVVLGNS